jgi:hypothetical protein
MKTLKRVLPSAVAAVSAALSMMTAVAAGNTSEATITVTGGPHAGTHALKVDDVGCEVSKSKGSPKYFNDNFGSPDVKDPKKLSFVLVRIRNADSPGGPAPADFEASVTFGAMNTNGSTFYMSGTNNTTGRKGGPGKLVLDENGKVAKVALDLQPQEGISIKGVVTCTIIKTP